MRRLSIQAWRLCAERNQSCQISARSVQEFRSNRWPKFAVSHFKELSPALTTVYAITCYTLFDKEPPDRHRNTRIATALIAPYTFDGVNDNNQADIA